MERLGRSELLRQVVHIGSGALALLTGWWGTPGTALLAGAATVFNLWLLPRLAPRLLRPAETAGFAVGVVSYPLAVLALAIVFSGRPAVVAAAWGVLAFGDGMATVVGRSLSSPPLPWNPAKSWLGTLAYWLFGSMAAGLLLQWVSSSPVDAAFVWTVAAVAVLGSALLESMPLGLDDNLAVPLLTGLTLALLLETEGGWEAFVNIAPGHWLAGLLVNAAFGLLAFLTGGIGVSGLLSGIAIGVVIYAALGLPGWVVLAVFYVLGSATTRLGLRRKRDVGLAEANRGRRSMRNVLANGVVPVICAVLAVVHTRQDLFVAAFVASLAAAAGDTVSSEIGQLAAGRTRLVTTLARVAPGTEGGISLVGSLAGVLGAAIVVVTAVQGGVIPQSWATAVTLSGVGAIFVDSLLGAAFERRRLLDNEAVNFGATLSAALAAFWWVALLHSPI